MAKHQIGARWIAREKGQFLEPKAPRLPEFERLLTLSQLGEALVPTAKWVALQKDSQVVGRTTTGVHFSFGL